ncbi:hypothetical protein DCS_01585 [Drechmeria coniospora]|uniref:Uncharacterized protein n=1 Tax=Drechmeria coniospora TaxID=98403 RepID=A0A151GTQ0_DRECN|nr:hypothetical protein DCS_01585 [Drechmeria coniospora]KYK60448.1 hypothetical protein DCS_01585 [Drechmeria coniospora]
MARPPALDSAPYRPPYRTSPRSPVELVTASPSVLSPSRPSPPCRCLDRTVHDREGETVKARPSEAEPGRHVGWRVPRPWTESLAVGSADGLARRPYTTAMLQRREIKYKTASSVRARTVPFPCLASGAKTAAAGHRLLPSASIPPRVLDPNRDVPSGHAGPVIMCYQLVELYAACRCLYYQHAIDRCASYGRPGHGVQPRTIYVGYACSLHTSRSAQHAPPHSYADSGYHSGRSTHKNDH